jgi:hypothetical protein
VSGRETGWADLLGAGALLWKSKEEKHQLHEKIQSSGTENLGKHTKGETNGSTQDQNNFFIKTE